MKTRPLIFIAVLLSIALSAVWLAPVPTQQPAPSQLDSFPLADNPFTPVDSSSEHKAEKQQLEHQVQTLSQRVTQLEKQLAQLQKQNAAMKAAAKQQSKSKNTPGTHLSRSQLLNKKNLVAAGVDPALAENIINRMSELEYRRLELRDRAKREKYLGTRRYVEELGKLNQQSVDLRQAIGDQAYDQFLYKTGQVNRVKVTSVMKGSPAELAGVQPGDQIIRYAGNRIFDWNGIRQATEQGNLGDYVTVSILRNGEPMSIMLPRGPMGVRLDSILGNPADLQ